MKANELIISLMKKQKISQTDLAKTLNLTRATVHDTLGKEKIQVPTLVKYLDALGYDLVVMPKKSTITVDDWIG